MIRMQISALVKKQNGPSSSAEARGGGRARPGEGAGSGTVCESVITREWCRPMETNSMRKHVYKV